MVFMFAFAEWVDRLQMGNLYVAIVCLLALKHALERVFGTFFVMNDACEGAHTATVWSVGRNGLSMVVYVPD